MKKTLIYALLSLFVTGGIFASASSQESTLSHNPGSVQIFVKEFPRGIMRTIRVHKNQDHQITTQAVRDAIKKEIGTDKFNVLFAGKELTDKDAKNLTVESILPYVLLK